MKINFSDKYLNLESTPHRTISLNFFDSSFEGNNEESLECVKFVFPTNFKMNFLPSYFIFFLFLFFSLLFLIFCKEKWKNELCEMMILHTNEWDILWWMTVRGCKGAERRLRVDENRNKKNEFS